MNRETTIITILNAALTPIFLKVDNESSLHHVPKGSETHFKICLVSEAFNNLTRVQRHRLVQTLLKDEFNQGLHALSLWLYTQSEWEKETDKVSPSPPCRGGFDHE